MLIAATLQPARGQGGPPDGILVPDTSVANPGDAGLRAHTNHLIRLQPAWVHTESPINLARTVASFSFTSTENRHRSHSRGWISGNIG